MLQRNMISAIQYKVSIGKDPNQTLLTDNERWDARTVEFIDETLDIVERTSPTITPCVHDGNFDR